MNLNIWRHTNATWRAAEVRYRRRAWWRSIWWPMTKWARSPWDWPYRRGWDEALESAVDDLERLIELSAGPSIAKADARALAFNLRREVHTS